MGPGNTFLCDRYYYYYYSSFFLTLKDVCVLCSDIFEGGCRANFTNNPIVQQIMAGMFAYFVMYISIIQTELE